MFKVVDLSFYLLITLSILITLYIFKDVYTKNNFQETETKDIKVIYAKSLVLLTILTVLFLIFLSFGLILSNNTTDTSLILKNDIIKEVSIYQFYLQNMISLHFVIIFVSVFTAFIFISFKKYIISLLSIPLLYFSLIISSDLIRGLITNKYISLRDVREFTPLLNVLVFKNTLNSLYFLLSTLFYIILISVLLYFTNKVLVKRNNNITNI